MDRKKNLRVLILTKHGPAGPSARYRYYQFIPFLEMAGLRITISPFFTDNYLKGYFSTGKKEIIEVVFSVLRRLIVLFTWFRYKAIIVEYELIPYFPPVIERMARLFRVKYIVGYDDAVFSNYENSPCRILRSTLGNKIGTVMQNARIVIAGNSFLEAYALRFNSNVQIIPTVVSKELYDKVVPPVRERIFTVGWIGSPSTSEYLLPYRDIFIRLSENGVCFRFVGFNNDLKKEFEGANVNFIEWHSETEIEEIKRFDIGIMPLYDDIWSRGKCGFKLIQYMASSLPVIASPVGVNSEIVRQGYNGFLAVSIDEWEEKILFFRDNPDFRIEMGKKGYEIFSMKYSLESISQKFVQLVLSVVSGENSKLERNVRESNLKLKW